MTPIAPTKARNPEAIILHASQGRLMSLVTLASLNRRIEEILLFQLTMYLDPYGPTSTGLYKDFLTS